MSKSNRRTVTAKAARQGNAALIRFARLSAEYAKAGTIDVVHRPPGVSADAFGLKIVGDCLAPRAREGQIVIVEPTLPAPGELIVLWLQGAETPVIKVLSQEIYGYPVHPESEVISFLCVEQLNPPAKYTVRMDKVECIASGRVMGRYFGKAKYGNFTNALVRSQ